MTSGTEEEHDRLRAIASQGPDFDKFEKYKARNTYNDRVGLHPDPKKNVLGAYVDHSVVNTMTERDILYEQLIEIKAEEKGRMLGTSCHLHSIFVLCSLSRRPYPRVKFCTE